MIAFIQRYALYGMGAVILALGIYGAVEHRAAVHNLAGWQTEQDAHALDIATWRAASAKAIADNIADVRAKESAAAVITEKANHDLESQLADARRLAADYARRVRAGTARTDQGGAGKTEIGAASGTPGSFVLPDGMSLVAEDDLRICSVNTVKAKGWLDWYASLRTRYNADGKP